VAAMMQNWKVDLLTLLLYQPYNLDLIVKLHFKTSAANNSPPIQQLQLFTTQWNLHSLGYSFFQIRLDRFVDRESFQVA